MKRLHVELANTPLKRERGLMGRKKMAKDQGMLFNFPYSRRLSFWMNNTYLPLEIAFINEEGIITEIQEMIPMNTRAITSKSRCKYALEVNKGWFRDNGVREGASVAGIGIKSNLNTCRIAQMTPQIPQGAISVEPGIETPPRLEEPLQQEPLFPEPDVILDKTRKEILEEADIQGKNLLITYITKKWPNGEGNEAIGPKLISPPFTFKEDEDGHHSAIVKAWDNQDAGWKSFLIDNITDLEQEKELPQENEENLHLEQEKENI